MNHEILWTSTQQPRPTPPPRLAPPPFRLGPPQAGAPPRAPARRPGRRKRGSHASESKIKQGRPRCPGARAPELVCQRRKNDITLRIVGLMIMKKRRHARGQTSGLGAGLPGGLLGSWLLGLAPGVFGSVRELLGKGAPAPHLAPLAANRGPRTWPRAPRCTLYFPSRPTGRNRFAGHELIPARRGGHGGGLTAQCQRDNGRRLTRQLSQHELDPQARPKNPVWSPGRDKSEKSKRHFQGWGRGSGPGPKEDQTPLEDRTRPFSTRS